MATIQRGLAKCFKLNLFASDSGGSETKKGKNADTCVNGRPRDIFVLGDPATEYLDVCMFRFLDIWIFTVGETGYPNSPIPIFFFVSVQASIYQSRCSTKKFLNTCWGLGMYSAAYSRVRRPGRPGSPAGQVARLGRSRSSA